MTGPHPSHKTRVSDASSFDEICVKCGATDITNGGWGELARPCPVSDREYDDRQCFGFLLRAYWIEERIRAAK